MNKKPEQLTGEAELENVLKMNAYLGCRGTHRNAEGRLMPCSSPESLARVSDRAEPEKKGRRKRRREFERFRERGVLGIDTLPGGGLVSAPIVVKVANETPRAKRRKARADREAATPAPAKDQIFGSERNPKGSARSVSSASNIEMTTAVEESLKNKVRQHNEKMRAAGKPDHAMASLRALKSVYRRGAGAFSISHRPGKTRGQWAMARVNAFLYLLEKGNPRNVRYVTDNDLLPTGHPKSTKWMFVHPELKAIGRRGVRRLAGAGIGGGRRGRGRSFRPGEFDPNAEDRDADGMVQDGTRFERPVASRDVMPGAGRPATRGRPSSDTTGQRISRAFARKPRRGDGEQSVATEPVEFVSDSEDRQRRLDEAVQKLNEDFPDPRRTGTSGILDSNGQQIVVHPGPELNQAQIEEFKGGSAMAHLEPDGEGGFRFTPERQALHDDIVRRHVEGRVPRENPRYVMKGGGSGSGKSEVERAGSFDFPDPKESTIVDSDEIKKMLPEYNAMNSAGNSEAAAFAHEESSYLAKRIQATAFENRFDFVLDGTGDSGVGSVQKKIAAAKNSGYAVQGAYVTIDTEEAFVRAKKRAENLQGSGAGRVVPSGIIVETHTAVSRIFEDIYKDFDEVYLFDNNDRPPPVMIARAVKGEELEILNQEAYDRFLAKKDYVYDISPDEKGVMKATLVSKGTEGVDLEILNPEGYARVVEQRNEKIRRAAEDQAGG